MSEAALHFGAPSPSDQLGMMSGARQTALATRHGAANRVEKRLRPVLLPVHEKQPFGVRGQSVQHLAAEDAVLAVAGFEVLVLAEAERVLDASGQARAEELAVIAKPAVEDGDLDALSAQAVRVPALDAEVGEVLGALRARR